MSISLLGIIGLQSYWIRQALQLSEENFNAGANDALNQVAEQLRKQEFTNIMLRVYADKDKNSFIHDSLSGEEHKKVKDKTQVLIELQKEADHLLDGHFVWVEDSMGEKEDSLFSRFSSINVEIDADKGKTTVQRRDSIVVSTIFEEFNNLRLKEKTINQAGELFLSTLVELKTSRLPIEDRIDSLEIDSLIGSALEAQGLYGMSYRFIVQTAPANRMVFLPTDRSLGKFLASRHHVALFAGLGLGEEQHLLRVYFPNQNMHTFRSIAWLAFASILFTGIILLCFWLSIRTIFRQKKLSEIKNDFINNMTHELKTPLATISLAADSLANPMVQANPGQITQYAEVIKEENQRMHRQVERVLQAARFGRQEIQLKEVAINMHELIKQVVRPIRLQVAEREGKLTLDLQAESSVLHADKVHLTNIISNLLDNANKYSYKAPEILVSTQQSGNFLEINVSDKGIGIHPREQKYIFERFYRVSTGNLHNVKGFGLGLSYVREIVQAHGGTISVRSAVGRGSTFTIKLPLKD